MSKLHFWTVWSPSGGSLVILDVRYTFFLLVLYTLIGFLEFVRIPESYFSTLLVDHQDVALYFKLRPPILTNIICLADSIAPDR